MNLCINCDKDLVSGIKNICNYFGKHRSYTNVFFLFLADSEFIRFCETEQVVNYTKVTETLTITSPDYPNTQYSINNNCSIQVSLQKLPLNQSVLHILHQSTAEPNTANCTRDYIIQNKSSSLFTNKQETTNKDVKQCTIIVDILLTKKQDSVVLHLPAGTKNGFSFTFRGNDFIFLKTLQAVFFIFKL